MWKSCTKMFRAGMEYNMCLSSVVGSDTKLKITPQGQYEEQNLLLGINQTHGVVQGQHGVQHVPLLCGGKWYEAQNHTTGSVWGAKLNFGWKSDPRSCSGPTQSTTCASSLWWEVIGSSKSKLWVFYGYLIILAWDPENDEFLMSADLLIHEVKG